MLCCAVILASYILHPLKVLSVTVQTVVVVVLYRLTKWCVIAEFRLTFISCLQLFIIVLVVGMVEVGSG